MSQASATNMVREVGVKERDRGRPAGDRRLYTWREERQGPPVQLDLTQTLQTITIITTRKTSLRTMT